MPLILLLDILIEFMNMILSFFNHLLNIKSVYFQLIGHENNIRCDKSASNPDTEPLAMDLPSAVNDLSQLLLSTATEVATSIAPTRPKRTSLASYSAISAVILPPSPERVGEESESFDSRAHRRCTWTAASPLKHLLGKALPSSPTVNFLNPYFTHLRPDQ